MNVVRNAGNVLILCIGIAALLLEALGTLPAPTLPQLALAVVVPELAPWAVPVTLLYLVAVAARARGNTRRWGLVCGAFACLLALVPLVEFPSARAASERELRSAGITRTGVPPAAAGPVAELAGEPVRTRDGATLALDVYRSGVSGPRPTLVTIYGGAWRFGTRSATASLDRFYARRGYTVVAIDYRHAPRYRFPVQIDDVRAALATIARHAGAWNVDPTRVAILGRSAGAELALLAAYEPGPLRIRAAIGYYAPADLVAGYRDPPSPDPADVRAILRAYIGGVPSTHARAYALASPLSHVRAGLPPTLLAIGLRDALVRPAQQRALRDALRAHGDRVAALELPWSNHVFDALPSGLGARLVSDATQRFLATTLR